jgi:predicted DNA-binding transcriptional regulator YafY
MDQLQRFYKIDQLLTLRRSVPTDVLLKELEVSPATLKRDITYMRDYLHAPVKFDRSEGGYVFEKGPQVGPKYELPGLWFNESELHALLTAQELLTKVEPGLLAPHVQPLQAKIEAILASLNDEPKEISKRVRIFALGRRKMESKHFQIIATATIRCKQLKIRHYNRATNAHTERVVSPQQIVYYRDNWYMDCWCHLREELRSFSIDAIESVELMSDKSKTLSIKEVREVLGSGYGIFSGKTVQWAKLRIGPNKARWVSRTVWHSQQKSSFDEEGHYLLEIPYNDDRELVNDILGMLPEVEIMAPESLRERVINVLKQSVKKISQL